MNSSITYWTYILRFIKKRDSDFSMTFCPRVYIYSRKHEELIFFFHVAISFVSGTLRFQGKFKFRSYLLDKVTFLLNKSDEKIRTNQNGGVAQLGIPGELRFCRPDRPTKLQLTQSAINLIRNRISNSVLCVVPQSSLSFQVSNNKKLIIYSCWQNTMDITLHCRRVSWLEFGSIKWHLQHVQHIYTHASRTRAQ